MSYKFWSIYNREYRNGWLCIPPNKEYIPKWYPRNALVKKHEEEILPPPSYWLQYDYEDMVYNNTFL